MNIPQAIKMYREMRNYTQQYMADRLNISQNAYSKLESGKTQVSVERLIEIAEILDISILHLLSLHNDSNAYPTGANGSNSLPNISPSSHNITIELLYDNMLLMKDEIRLLVETLNLLLINQNGSNGKD